MPSLRPCQSPGLIDLCSSKSLMPRSSPSLSGLNRILGTTRSLWDADNYIDNSLLGVSPTSPWETAQEFFAALARKETLFTHTWQLVGREAPLAEALEAHKNRTLA